jgi:hypothetical protein
MPESYFGFADGILAGPLMSIGKNRHMVFDWIKAAKIIKEQKPRVASAGLNGDWSHTGGDIYNDGKPVFDSYTYLQSIWAKPTLVLNDDEELECWLYTDEDEYGWDEKTKWPKEAIDILND